MRAGLRAEYPDLVERARRLPRPSLAAAAPGWAALAALGAAFVTGAFALAILMPLWPTASPTAIRPFELSSLLASAAAGAIASAVGGRRGVLLYLGCVVARALVQVAVADASRALLPPDLAQAISTGATVVEPWPGLLREWPALIGVPVGLALARGVRRGAAGANPLLEGAGAFSVAAAIVTIPFGLLAPVASRAGNAQDEFIVASILLGELVQAAAAGWVIAARSTRPLRTAASVAAVAIVGVLPFEIPQLDLVLRYGAGWQLIVPFAPFLGAALLLVATLSWQRTRSVTA